MNYFLQTDRLQLREFILLDTTFILELLNSPGWLQFIGDRNVHTKEDAEKYLQNGPLKSYKENGFWLSMIIRKEDDLPIGMCGLLKRDMLENPDLGFAFLSEFTGRGYAFEIAHKLLLFAKKKVGGFTKSQQSLYPPIPNPFAYLKSLVLNLRKRFATSARKSCFY